MQFTHTRSRELRAGRLTLAGVLLAETPLWAGLAWFLHGPLQPSSLPRPRPSPRDSGGSAPPGWLHPATPWY